METGKCTFTFKYNEPTRAVSFSYGASMLVTGTDPFMGSSSKLYLYSVAENQEEQTDIPMLTIDGFPGHRSVQNAPVRSGQG